eukprot:TRINITY_DN4838_c0_g1_i1.p1 TRINITY_DN4838_c0_g1~~TRINITY_DN4838_c0_g1_i1.p1  ORF type:complete len:777 (+),score=272.15 TRINITY_DN4838_c0_g1_i1:119-2449(+)
MAAKRQQPAWNPPERKERNDLHVYNSLTSSKVKFVPEKGNKVSWYICGPTVYDSSHLGHARNYVTFDIIRRILEDYFNYEVYAVMNITDVDDKIILKARKNHLLAEYINSHPTFNDQVAKDVQDAVSFYKNKLEGKIADKEAEVEKLKKERHAQAAHTVSLEAGLLKKNLETTLEVQKELDANKAKLAANQSFDVVAFLKQAGEALSEFLDKQFGSTITDQQIFRKHAAYYEKEYLEDMISLGVRMPDVLTRVSEYIPEIIETTSNIIKNGFAYESNGSVYFDTEAFTNGNHFYAKLEPNSAGNQKLAEEGEGALSEGKQTEKKNGNDFALWKKSKDGEPRWNSPWGEGRPGWHIECTAMACSIFGKTLDIHSGGIDLRFPHHDNEIAQAEAAFCSDKWVHYFLHSGHLHIDGLKMAKSLKNFLTIREALQKCTAKQLRYMFLIQPWNNIMNFSFSNIEEARSKEKTFSEFFLTVKNVIRDQGFGIDASQRWEEAEMKLNTTLEQAQLNVHNALADNFDTGSALQALVDLVTATNTYIFGRKDRKAYIVRKVAAYINKILRVFGIVEAEADITFAFDSNTGDATIDKESIIRPYVAAIAKFRTDVRTMAREKRPLGDILALSDALRDDVMPELGVRLEDSGEFPFKIVDRETLIAERDKARAQARAQAIEKLQKRLANTKKELDGWTAKSTDPKTKFGETVTVNESGKAVLTEKAETEIKEKKTKTKLLKDYETAQKNFTAYQKKLETEPDFLSKLKDQVQQMEAELEAALKSPSA